MATLPCSENFAINSPLHAPVKLRCRYATSPSPHLAGTSTVFTLMPAFSAFAIAARTPLL